MKVRKTIIVVAIVLGFAGMAKADIVQLDLFGIGSPQVYDFDSPSWTSDFDLGVTFTEISNVYIDWSGGITAGMAVNSQNPTPFPLEVGIYASLDYPPLRRTEVRGGEATYPNSEPFDYLSQIGPSGTLVWSDLLDGQSTITIGYTEIIMLNGEYIEHGSITLDSATLVVEGVVVPEPATLLFLALGGLVIRA